MSLRVDLTLGHFGGAEDVFEEGIFIGSVAWGDVILQPFFKGAGEVLKFEPPSLKLRRPGSSKVLKFLWRQGERGVGEVLKFESAKVLKFWEVR